MLTIVGNGPSRKQIDLDSLERWWGCNAIYRDATPELLFAVDIRMHIEILHEGYYKNNKLAVGNFDYIERGHLPMLKFGHQDFEIHEFFQDDDDFMVIQGAKAEDFVFEDAKNVVTFLGVNSKYMSNIIRYDYSILKNLLAGQAALGYALLNGEREIALLGFDALQYDMCENVYQGSNFYRDKYTSEDGVMTAQKAQFIALLEHFKDSKVYFQKSIDEYEEIDYTTLSYYENVMKDKWILGQGYESDPLADKMTNTIV